MSTISPDVVSNNCDLLADVLNGNVQVRDVQWVDDCGNLHAVETLEGMIAALGQWELREREQSYRPWTRAEVPLNTELCFEATRFVILSADVHSVTLGLSGQVVEWNYATLLARAKQQNGEPCGVRT